ncbi:hypothetical protein H5P28_17720 [Ruficoccus amylovorans]|uniref:Uncharacterized protein n=1 Tax=Ruficoccus amylovorans TaxID=1804625 RepID=A0A842HIZ4_9BACT|nr:hypothetical protein [Ruficoccus amylovorans]MBC2596110.1 hypothetical protein [Ruficoccus amylovorans]
MKFLPAALAALLALAAPAFSQTAPDADKTAPAKAQPADSEPADSLVNDGEMRPYLGGWLGEYGGICAYTNEGPKPAEVSVQVNIRQTMEPSHIRIDTPADGSAPIITIFINNSPTATDERMKVTAETLEMAPKYADPVSFEAKRITGGFGGTESLIDGEIKIYRISLNAAPKPVETYRFRIGEE